MKDNKLINVSIDTIFEVIRDIKDPEHPNSLEELQIVSKNDIKITEIDDEEVLCKCNAPIKSIEITITPTVPHCSMAGIIGICVLSELERLIDKYWIKVIIKENSHVNRDALNKQLSDKDRVMAALENDSLIDLISSCVLHVKFYE
ncbi:MAG: DUF59 domain-containing protein [Romboutsia sp.]|nr:DUF59 domain-containing protein [Romboutsia sp.]